MSLYSTVNKILSIARRQPDVFDAGEGDIYETLNGRMDIAYPLVWLTQQQHPQDMAVDGDFNTFTFTLFYVDRLTSDRSNRLQVQSHAIEVLRSIARELETETDLPTKNYVTFTERFESMCAGAYLEFSMYDILDDACVETFAPPVLHSMYYHTTDGKAINTNGSAEFGEGLLVFNRAMEETAYVYVDGKTYSVNGELKFYGVPTNVPEVALFQNANLDAIYLLPTVNAIGNRAFEDCPNLTTIGGSAATENIISYASLVFSNTKIGETFSLGSKTTYIGGGILSGVTNFPDGIIDINMTSEKWSTEVSKENNWADGSNIQCRRFTDRMICGEEPEPPEPPVEYTFTFNNSEGDVFGSGTTANTISWTTDYPGVVTWEFSEGTSGTTEGNSVTVTFSENTGDTVQGYDFTAYDDSGETLGDISFFVLGEHEDSGSTSGSTEYFPDNRSGYSNEYLTLEILSGGTLVFDTALLNMTMVHEKEYSRNAGETWNSVSSGSTINVNAGERINLRGVGTGDDFKWDLNIKGTAAFNAEGNIRSYARYAYAMFKGSNVVSAKNLIIEQGDWCDLMFEDCEKLVEAPALPATVLRNNCYEGMFMGCTSLTTAPDLPATKLPAECYRSMFMNCTSLVNVPSVLPATELGERCCEKMFQYCTSLETAPELPAATLSEKCYHSMFLGCSKLSYIKCLATDISANKCTTLWTQRTSNTGTFVKAAGAEWPQGGDGIPAGWTVEEAS